MKSPILVLFFIFFLKPGNTNADSEEASIPDGKMQCAREIFQLTIDDLTEFSGSQLENLQNITPATRRKLKRAVMDILATLGLLLEISTSPTVSIGTVPVFVLRAKKLMDRLNRDMENLRPETEILSEQLKDGLFDVIMDLPLKTFKCLNK